MEREYLMSKIAILTDSSADLTPEQASKYGIDVLTFVMTLDGKDYKTNENCTVEEFYDILRQGKGVPSTAAITQLQFCEQFCHYVDEGYTDVLYVSICKSGSSTYNNAVMAKQMLAEERPGNTMRIHIVDSRTYSMTFGWYLLEAARKIRNGAELAPIIAELEDIYSRCEIALAAYSLKQMKKSGRISAAAAFAGELLGLRPIIQLNFGVSKVVAKVRGNDAVPAAMIKQVQNRVADVSEMRYQIGYTDCEEAAQNLAKQCKKAFGHAPEGIFHLGGVVSCNTGPDAIAIAYLNSEHKE